MSFEKALAKEIKRLRDRLALLTGLGNQERAGEISRTRNTPRRRRVSPKVRAQRVLQGRYMSAVRSLPASQKKRIAAVRAKDGYRKAIAVAQRLTKGAGRKPTRRAKPTKRMRKTSASQHTPPH